MKVLFSNISGAFIFAGQKYGEMLFRQYDLAAYISFFKKHAPDILSLTEVHLEDQNKSKMVQEIARALDLPHYKVQFMHESHLDTSKQMGTAILSKWPIISSQIINLKAPRLKVDRPNGDHWVMFDKMAQLVTVAITDEAYIDIINLSYFPFHHFNRRLDEPDFADQRNQLVDFLLSNKNPTIITGDFNNKGLELNKAFPELFQSGFDQAVIAPTTVVGYNDKSQLDHILYKKDYFTVLGSFVEPNGSDHYAVGAEFQLDT